MQNTNTIERDPFGVSAHAPGAKLDSGKPRAGLCLLGFLPALQQLVVWGNIYNAVCGATGAWPHALMEVAKVTTVGASKYTPNGWKEVPDGRARYLDAWGRHVLALGRGEEFDDGPGGTGCLHLACAAWNLLAALSLDDDGEGVERSLIASLAYETLDALEVLVKESAR